MAELPVGLWIVFVGFCLPLLALCMITVRFGLFWEATREAADAAAQAQYYRDDATSPGQGAVTLATTTANNVAGMFSGLTITSVNCYIVVTPLVNAGNGNAFQRYGPDSCLTTPADLSKNIYQIEVDVSGQIQPLLSIGAGISIPGLNQPFPVRMSQLRVFENGPGLSQYSS